MSTQSSPGEPSLPSAAGFPAHPAAWYYFCEEAALAKGPVGQRHWTRDLVAFRTESGAVAVLDARCSHLGANLSCGKVAGEAIQCPFHHWSFGVDGVCSKIPAAQEIPKFARQVSYPVTVRHGCVFFFNGPEATFPLPFIENEAPEDFVAAKVFSYSADTTWFMIASQGFDIQHFESVHDRRLLSPPDLRQLSPFAFRSFYKAVNIGEELRDVVLRFLVGKTVELTMDNWGGTMFVIKAIFPRACSRFLVSFRPMEDGTTHFDVLVFTPRGIASLARPLRRWFTRAHLEAEASLIRGTVYRPTHLIPEDQGMIQCFHWLAGIPQRVAASEPTPATS